MTAGALAWCFPSFLLWKTSHFHILYASGVLFGVLTILQAVRMRESASRRGMFLPGLIAGVGLVTLAVFAVIAGRDRSAIPAAAATATLVAAAAWIPELQAVCAFVALLPASAAVIQASRSIAERPARIVSHAVA